MLVGSCLGGFLVSCLLSLLLGSLKPGRPIVKMLGMGHSHEMRARSTRQPSTPRLYISGVHIPLP